MCCTALVESGLTLIQGRITDQKELNPQIMHSIMQQASTFTVAKAEQALRIKQSVEYSRVDPDSRWFFADAIPGGGCGPKAKELLDLSSFHSVTALTDFDSFWVRHCTDGYVLRRLRMRSRRTMRGPSIEQSRYTHLAGGLTFAAVSWRRRQSAVTCQECELVNGVRKATRQAPWPYKYERGWSHYDSGPDCSSIFTHAGGRRSLRH